MIFLDVVFFPGGIDECSNGALNVVYFAILSSFLNVEPYHSAWRGLLTSSPMWYGAGVFIGSLISISPIVWLLIFLPRILLYMHYLVMCIPLRLSVICWLETSSITCFNYVGYFPPMLIIRTLVIFPAGNSLFCVIYIYFYC